MKKQTLLRVAIALVLGTVTAVGLVSAGRQTYNELPAADKDVSSVSAAPSESQADYELVSTSVAEVQEAANSIVSAECSTAPPGTEESTPSAPEEPDAADSGGESKEAVPEPETGIETDAEESGVSTSGDASSEAADSTPTADEICDEKLAGYIQQLEQLQSRSEKQLYQIMLSAYDEYLSKPESERGLVSKVSIVLSKSGELNKAQSTCDAEFEQIIREMRQTLQEYGRDETLADDAEASYKEKKEAMIKELTDQAFSGGDGSGRSGRWLKEHAAQLND